MTTLTEFLLARVADAEAVAREAIAERGRVEFIHASDNDPDFSMYANPDLSIPAVVVGPERVLAECEAKRRIVKLHQATPGKGYEPDDGDYYGDMTRCCTMCGAYERDGVPWPCATIKVLALPYADHADYDEAWRP